MAKPYAAPTPLLALLMLVALLSPAVLSRLASTLKLRTTSMNSTLRFTASWLLMMPKAKSMALALELLTAITSLA